MRRPCVARPNSASASWPLPELGVQPRRFPAGVSGLASTGGSDVAFAPGAVGPSKRWPVFAYAEVAKQLTSRGSRSRCWAGPARSRSRRNHAAPGPLARDLTGTDLRGAILALAAADVAISNDSGLLHVAAALGTPAVGIFGPTSPWLWAPLNPMAAAVQIVAKLDCQPCHAPTCRMRHHRCMRDIPAEQVLEVTQRALAKARA